MAKALYRKYRSKKLSEIVGQSHVTDILTRALADGRVSHAYLLTGPRGVGKTSIARILAHEINQLPYSDESTHLDIIEIDAASNNGVEDVRDLREKVQIAPVSAARKIYIIDEVHMLSKAAFNALLKTLEEPPEHAVFILATTDVDKLPPTIISRTQRYSFRSISTADAVSHLRHIADSEKLKIDDDALQLIAERGDGSFRDSISLLDQLRGLADDKAGITRELVEKSLGLAPKELVVKILEAYENRDLKAIVALVDESEAAGIQTTALVAQLVHAVRENIAEKPQLISLLDTLLDVAKSSQPNIKLLTVLAAHAAPKPKSAALNAPVAEVSAPVKELEELATSNSPSSGHDSRTIPSQNGFAPGLTGAPAPGQTRAADVLAREDASTRLTPASSQPQDLSSEGLSPIGRSRAPRASSQLPVERPEEETVLRVANGEKNSESAGDQTNTKTEKALDLDWQKLIDYARANYVAIYSVLSKCSYELNGDTLVLYTGGAFYKKKLDDAKHRVNLSKALAETGAGDLLIETIGTPPPPKDSTAAAVAAIMGGGEEVSVDA